MSKAQYERYLQSPEWYATRDRRLVAAGFRCEFREYIVVDIKHDHYGRRCSETKDLQVHHLSYARIGAERDDDLEVLCRFHHLVRHVAATECEYCGEATVPFDADAIDIVEQALKEAGGIDKLELDNIDAPGVCDYHEHMLSKND